MFTGIVTDIGIVEIPSPNRADIDGFSIHASYPADSMSVGLSVSCNGVCLTVTSVIPTARGCCFKVQVSRETLSRTTLGCWSSGYQVNLERALRIGDEVGGHWVTGHVDSVARIIERWSDGSSVRFRVSPPIELMKFISPRGSVALDGVSLTVNEVDSDSFVVNLVPYSLQTTIWGMCQPGNIVNIEIDFLARYVARLLEGGHERQKSGSSA